MCRSILARGLSPSSGRWPCSFSVPAHQPSKPSSRGSWPSIPALWQSPAPNSLSPLLVPLTPRSSMSASPRPSSARTQVRNRAGLEPAQRSNPDFHGISSRPRRLFKAAALFCVVLFHPIATAPRSKLASAATLKSKPPPSVRRLVGSPSNSTRRRAPSRGFDPYRALLSFYVASKCSQFIAELLLSPTSASSCRTPSSSFPSPCFFFG